MSDPNTNTNTNAPPSGDKPGLVAGHAEWAKGVAQTAVGSVTGSHAWTASGEQAKAHGLHTLRAAAADRDAATAGYGKAEEVAGKLTGCTGMQKEGAESTAAAAADKDK